jgi:hypothetical protein
LIGKRGGKSPIVAVESVYDGAVRIVREDDQVENKRKIKVWTAVGMRAEPIRWP